MIPHSNKLFLQTQSWFWDNSLSTQGTKQRSALNLYTNTIKTFDVFFFNAQG